MILSFIIGSIPSGYLLVQKVNRRDIRKFGSGNIGATNVYRLLGLKMGILVAVTDIVKGSLTVILISFGTSEPFFILLGGLVGILGHNYSMFLQFKGGRGVATTCGVLLALMTQPVLLVLLCWILLVVTTRYVSVASILASLLLLPLVYFQGYPLSYLLFTLLLVSFIIFRHKENIQRLLKGKENRLSWPPNVGGRGS